MATAAEYETMAARLTTETLRALWERVRDGESTPGWEPGKAFEYLVLRAFELEGAKVRWPYEVTMADQIVEQIDGVIHLPDPHLSCLVETKAHREKIPIGSIAKLRNQLLRRPATAIGAIFGLTGFTGPARTLAQFLAPQTILLWEGDEFEYAQRNNKLITGLATKHRKAIEEGLADYHLRTEEV